MMDYKTNRINKLKYEFGESNLNSKEIVSSEYRREINRKYKEKQDFPLLFHSFALTLDKLGGVSEEQNKKFSCFCFVLRSTCTNFG